MKSEARRLQSLQLAIDQHAKACGCPIRALQLNPFEHSQLDWDDFRGIPIESAPDLPTGVVRIDCLTTTVRDAYEDFKTVARDGSHEDALNDAEQRFEDKLEQLADKIHKDWPNNRDDQWWRKAAMREPEIYRRLLKGADLSKNEMLRLEIAQLPSARDRDLTDLFERWDDAYHELGVNVSDLGRLDEEFAAAWEDLPPIIPSVSRQHPSVSEQSPAQQRPRSLWKRLSDWWLELRLRRDLRRIEKRLR